MEPTCTKTLPNVDAETDLTSDGERVDAAAPAYAQ